LTRRGATRATAEAGTAGQAPDTARVRATGVAELLLVRARTNDRARDLLVSVAQAPSSPDGREGAAELGSSLNTLASRTDLFSVQGLLAFVSPSGEVIPGAGLPPSPSARAQLGF